MPVGPAAGPEPAPAGGWLAGQYGSTPRAGRTYYRCAARSLVPGSPAMQGHPKNVYLPQAAVLEPINAWIGAFDRTNRDRTVAALVASQDTPGTRPRAHETAKKRLVDAEARLRRFQAAIASGVDPAALVEAINQAQAQRAAARAELDATPAPNAVTDAEVYAMIDSIGDVGRALNSADPASLQQLYEALRLELIYDAEARSVGVTIRPTGRGSTRVRGGTCALTTRLRLGSKPTLALGKPSG